MMHVCVTKEAWLVRIVCMAVISISGCGEPTSDMDSTPMKAAKVTFHVKEMGERLALM